MKQYVRRITAILTAICGLMVFSGCEKTSDKKPGGIVSVPANSSENDTSFPSSSGTPSGEVSSTSENSPSTEENSYFDPTNDPSWDPGPELDVVYKDPLPVPSSANIKIRSLSEALANFSSIESKTPEGTPEEIVKTLLERNILCFATLQGKCWTYDEDTYSNNYEFSHGLVPIQSSYISSLDQIDDLFYGTYTYSEATYYIHYDGEGYPDDMFIYEDGIYADFSQVLKTAMNSFSTATYASIISSSSDEIVFGRYYEQYPTEGAIEPNNFFFKAVRTSSGWRLENYIIDAPAYRPMYSKLIQTNRVGVPDIEKIAMQELGNFGGEPYWGWYGFDYKIEWCAAFVSWCYYMAGANGPYFVAVNSEGIPWFKEKGQWAEADYRDIAPGDSIFLDWDLDGRANHVGLVIGTDGEKVYTIEGNRSDCCQQFAYDLDDPHIFGYGLMNWE